VEQAQKEAILQPEKFSLFCRTESGSEVGDSFMSPIHTCELNGAYPFDFFTELKIGCRLLAPADLVLDVSHNVGWGRRRIPSGGILG
jgi:hypothetical protein